MKKRILIALIFSISLGLGACADDAPANNNNNAADVVDENDIEESGDAGHGDADDSEPDSSDGPDGSDEPDISEGDALNVIVANDQVVAAAESNQATIAEATVEADAFVVVYAECLNCLVPGPGEIIGHQAIAAGEHTDVKVTVDHSLHNNQTYYALLHEDTDADATFDFVDFGGSDAALTNAAGAPITASFRVNVASILVIDQRLDDVSTLVNISEIYSAGPGWALIRAGACADSGPMIGLSEVAHASRVNVSVELYRPAQTGETLCALLHADTGTVGHFEYVVGDANSEDAPVQLADDSMVMVEFVVTVPDGTPAVRITLSSANDAEYIVDSVVPASLDGGLTSSGNPFLGLMAGWRYEIINTATAAHPFEFFVKGFTGDGVVWPDTVILSQAVGGSGEADADTNWVEDGDAIRFTVAGENWMGLVNIDGYRSANAPNAMRGEVGIYVQ